MNKFVLSNQAQDDIDEIFYYIAKRNVKGAVATGIAIQKTCAMIGGMPEIRHIVEPIGSEFLTPLIFGSATN
mgnify:CR=1 FL=1